MHVLFTKPDYQQYVMTSSALYSPIFMEGERFWQWFAENKKHSIAGTENTKVYLPFSLPGLSCCIQINSPQIIGEKTMSWLRGYG